jgi:hypothetical protein
MAFNAFDDKAARRTNLAPSTLDIIDDAQQYAEGRAIRLEVASADQIGIVVQLAAIKMAN